jgi:hypothetical protein
MMTGFTEFKENGVL